MPPAQPVRLLAPAKINLHLRVGPPAADGFHPLLSWMTTVGLWDVLTLCPADVPQPAVPWVGLVCDDPTLPCDATNLVVRAGQALAEVLHDKPPGEVFASLQKNIPMGAGLGGGSSDGASALLGLNRLWRAKRKPAQLAELSAQLGSDLPFFFHGPSSICTGRGQIVRPTSPPAARWALLILPAMHMPTPAVYRQFDRMGLGDLSRLQVEPDWQAWARLRAAELLPLLVNDLEEPAFAIRPELGRIRARIEQFLGRPVRMSGSGSSLFTLYDAQAEAAAAADRLSADFALRSLVVEVAPDSSSQTSHRLATGGEAR